MAMMSVGLCSVFWKAKEEPTTTKLQAKKEAADTKLKAEEAMEKISNRKRSAEDLIQQYEKKKAR